MRAQERVPTGRETAPTFIVSLEGASQVTGTFGKCLSPTAKAKFTPT